MSQFESVLDYVPEGAELKAKLNDITRGQLLRAMPSLKERAKTLIELISGAYFIFADRPLQVEPKAAALLTPETRILIGQLRTALEAVTDWRADTTEAAMRNFAEQNNLKLGARRPATPGGTDRAHDLAGYFRRSGGAGTGGMPCPSRRSGGRLTPYQMRAAAILQRTGQ